jgi:hypothetical protein
MSFWLAVGLLAVPLLLIPAMAWAEDGEGNWESEGTWTGANFGSGGQAGLYVMTSTRGGEFTLVGYIVQPPLWPNEARRTPYVGTGRRTGPRSWEYTVMSYIQDSAGNVLAFVAGHGTVTLVDPNTATKDEFYFAYLPGQNPFTEMSYFPLFGPFTGTAVRISYTPPLGL